MESYITSIPIFPSVTVQKPQIEFLGFEIQIKVLNEIPEDDRPIFELLCYFGLRPGEGRAIMKDCAVDGQLVIRRAFSENTLKERTKTNTIRVYEINPHVQDIIDRSIKSQRVVTKFVFVRKDGQPYTNKNLNNIWKAACGKVGIKIKLYNGVRHSLGCQLTRNGVDMSVVQKILGHKNIEMTQRYADHSTEQLTAVLNQRLGVIQEFKKKLNVGN